MTAARGDGPTTAAPGIAPRTRALFAGRDGRPVLMPYVTGGFPEPSACEAILQTLADEGADIIELGVPFSDPVADGPVVQASSQRALQAGVTPDRVFELAASVSPRVPVVLLTYANTVVARGVDAFVARAAACGVEGMVVPDLPVDEAAEVAAAAAAHGIALVPLAAPTTTDARLDQIAAAATSFIYCVAVTGVTGTRKTLGHELGPLCLRLRCRTATPLVAGFGISTPDQASDAAAVADGVIVGSALIDAIAAAGPDPRAAQAAAAALIRPIREALA